MTLAHERLESQMCGFYFMGRLGHTFLLFFGPRDRSETLRNGPGMLLDKVSAQTVDSEPDSDRF